MNLNVTALHHKGETSAPVDQQTWPVLDTPHYLQVREDGFVPELPRGQPIIATAKLWQTRLSDFLTTKAALGLLLTTDEDLIAVQGNWDRITLIVIDAHSADDVRAEFIAQRLRSEFGYRGQLAIFRSGLDTRSASQPETFDAIAYGEERESHAAHAEIYSRSERLRRPSTALWAVAS